MKKKIKPIDVWLNIVDFLRLIAITALAALLFLMFIARKMEVVGPSMYPTLEEKETVFINVAASFFTKIDRFDVVVVRNTQTDELWVKRVIGLPKETVEFKNDQLFIDGAKVDQPFLDKTYMEKIKKELHQTTFTKDSSYDTLGEDEYLLVGDNRNNSLDSRNAAVGPFKRDQIIAKGVFVAWPLSKVRYVSDGN